MQSKQSISKTSLNNKNYNTYDVNANTKKYSSNNIKRKLFTKKYVVYIICAIISLILFSVFLYLAIDNKNKQSHLFRTTCVQINETTVNTTVPINVISNSNDSHKMYEMKLFDVSNLSHVCYINMCYDFDSYIVVDNQDNEISQNVTCSNYYSESVYLDNNYATKYWIFMSLSLLFVFTFIYLFFTE
jgi:hypothetical protein